MELVKELERYLLSELISDRGIQKDSIDENEDLISPGILDSLGILKLTEFLERNFSIKISDEDLEPENFQNLNRLKSFVEMKKSK